MLKSLVGLPEPRWPPGVDMKAEARKARRRLYPVTLLYSSGAALVLALVLGSGRNLAVALAFLGAGVATWTLLEYLVHRYILHGLFPDGPWLLRHLLHKRFDHLHVQHHQRPWDGDHINGSVGDTLPFVVVLGGLASLAPVHTLPVMLVGLVQAYVFEEWVHHSVHYYSFRWRYFRYIRLHHLYHHSRHGTEVAFGLTSGMWDAACGTRLPREVRERSGRQPAA